MTPVNIVRKLMKDIIEESKMNPCQVNGCGKSDAEKPMAYRGEKYCSDIHRRVLNGELKLEMVPAVIIPMTNENSVVE